MNRIAAAALNIAAALGILTALLGIALDFLPGGSPGLNLPQILLIAAGLLCFLTALILRSAHVRRRVSQNARKHWKPGLLVTAMTLIALEFILAAADIPTYFPPPPDDVPQPFYQPAPWWTCDEAGCHYVQRHIAVACASEQIYDRECIINRQGFHDTQDFTASDDLNGRMRILTLGDSFTFGASADIGESYVETIESNFPQTIVWNTAVPATATNQALASFQTYAPILQPQLAILGFFPYNDFIENMMPIDYRAYGIDWNGKLFKIWRYQIESSGKVSALDYRHLYYSRHRISPPTSEIEHLIGRTRLGSLLPRFLYKVSWDADQDPYILIPTAMNILTPPTVDITRGYLRALRAAATAQDTALLILLIPAPADLDAPNPHYQTAIQLMRELKIPWLDPIPALDAELDYLPPPDGHWNTAGHQKIGALLSDCLEAFHISQDLADCQQVKMP